MNVLFSRPIGDSRQRFGRILFEAVERHQGRNAESIQNAQMVRQIGYAVFFQCTGGGDNDRQIRGRDAGPLCYGAEFFRAQIGAESGFGYDDVG